MDARRCFTVWRFRSVDGKQVADVVRSSEPNDDRVQHEYQKILWQGLAHTKAEALGNAAARMPWT